MTHRAFASRWRQPESTTPTSNARARLAGRARHPGAVPHPSRRAASGSCTAWPAAEACSSRRPTVRLEDAQTITLAGREWVAVHTPGHTEDHLCLFDPAEGTFLSGDHVLPTITPHIGDLATHADLPRRVLHVARQGGPARRPDLDRPARPRRPVHQPSGAGRGHQAPPPRAARKSSATRHARSADQPR